MQLGPTDLPGLRASELGRAARHSLASGDFGEAVRAKQAKDTAERVLLGKDEELARVVVKAACRLEEQNSILWELANNFYLISRKKQILLVERFVKGFATLPAAEQAKGMLALAPRVRAARRGWSQDNFMSEAKKKTDKKSSRSRGALGEASLALPLASLVGARGRREADVHIVRLLDAIDASLRRMAEEDRNRLFRRMDRAVSSSFTPVVLARLLAQLPPEEVQAFESWVVDERALPPAAARRLFAALTSAQTAGTLMSEVAEDLSAGADALWARLSADFASRPDEIDSSWTNWLQGRPPSPGAGSVLADAQCDEDDLLSVHSAPAGRRRATFAGGGASSSSSSKGSIGPAMLGGGYTQGSSRRAPSPQSRRKGSCQLYCPAEMFLWSGGKASVSASRSSWSSAKSSGRGVESGKTLLEFVSVPAKVLEEEEAEEEEDPLEDVAAGDRAGVAAAGKEAIPDEVDLETEDVGIVEESDVSDKDESRAVEEAA